MSLASVQSISLRLTPKITKIIFSKSPKSIFTPEAIYQLNKYYYCNTSHTKAPIRRRRGQAGASAPELFHDPNSDSDEGKILLPTSITSDPKEFLNRANDLLEHVYTAVLPMKKFNDVFDIDLPPNMDAVAEDRELSIRLDPRYGSFFLRIDPDNMTVQFTSPISGYYEYIPNAQTGAWVNTEDSHDLTGLMTRDLIRICNGLPNF